MNILLVDDNPTLRSEFSLFFSENGHQVTEAQSGRDGIVKYYTIGSTYFDIIVTNTVLCGMSGKEMAERIKYSYLGSKVPILAISTDFEQDYSANADSIFSLVLPKFISKSKLLDFCLLMAGRAISSKICRVV